MQQLPLSIHIRDDATFASFYVSAKNVTLLASLQASIRGEGEQITYLWGSEGAGCTHLLHAACHFASEQERRVAYLPLRQHAELAPQLLEGLHELDLLCLDDVDAIAGNGVWEEALFNCYNRVREHTCRLLVSGNNAATQLLLDLPDLRSRLAWGVSFQVHALSDEDKIAALQMRAKLRGLELSVELAQFLLSRCPRDSHALFAILEKLDHASLSAQRKLTIPFVKQVLEI